MTVGTPTKPYYAIKLDKAGGGMTRRRAKLVAYLRLLQHALKHRKQTR